MPLGDGGQCKYHRVWHEFMKYYLRQIFDLDKLFMLCLF